MISDFSLAAQPWLEEAAAPQEVSVCLQTPWQRGHLAEMLRSPFSPLLGGKTVLTQFSNHKKKKVTFLINHDFTVTSNREL